MKQHSESWADVTRRKALGTMFAGTGLLLSGLGLNSVGAPLRERGRVLLKGFSDLPKGLQEAIEFPLLEAIYGRRSRRFFMGAEIPDGPLAYKSEYDPMPLSELEQMMVLTAVGGNTGWHHLIFRHKKYAPHLSNYAGAAVAKKEIVGRFNLCSIIFTKSIPQGGGESRPIKFNVKNQ